MNSITTEPTVITPTAIALARALQEGRAKIEAAETELDALHCDVVQDGAAWPDTNLIVTMGEWSLSVPVWYVAGWQYGAHPTRSGGEWYADSSDGQFTGFRPPKVGGDEEADTWTVEIHGGDNIGSAAAELVAASEAEADEAAEIIGDALRAAYDAISVPEPSDEDLIAHMADLTVGYVSLSANGIDVDTGKHARPIGECYVEIRGTIIMGGRHYSVRANSNDRWNVEDDVVSDPERAAAAAIGLLKDMVEDCLEGADKAESALAGGLDIDRE